MAGHVGDRGPFSDLGHPRTASSEGSRTAANTKTRGNRIAEDSEDIHNPTPALPVGRKRQRSRSRERASKGLWGAAAADWDEHRAPNGRGSSGSSPRSPLAPVLGNNLDDLLDSSTGMHSSSERSNDSTSESPVAAPATIPVCSRSKPSSESCGRRTDSPSSVRHIPGMRAGDELLYLQGADEVISDQDLWQRVSHLQARGFDSSVMRVMHEVMYDDDDDCCGDVAFSGVDGTPHDSYSRVFGDGGSSPGDDVVYVPCEPMDSSPAETCETGACVVESDEQKASAAAASPGAAACEPMDSDQEEARRVLTDDEHNHLAASLCAVTPMA